MNPKKIKLNIEVWRSPQCPVEEKWSIVCNVLESLGFSLEGFKGSHAIFYHKDLEKHPNFPAGRFQIKTINKKKVEKKFPVIQFTQVKLDNNAEHSYIILN